jgi:glycosyltransferase involved in cell wall biosynthesis
MQGQASFPNPPVGKSGWPWTAETDPRWREIESRQSWPKISIVTPSYNQGQYLEETIRSVLLKGYPNLEYIIMDGGSTDDSVDIIRRYEPWLTYWVSEPDHGQCHAINKGFEQATGDIFGWLNSDDMFTPNALEKVAGLLVNRDASLLVGTSVVTNSENTFNGRVDRRQPSWESILYDFRTFPQPSVFWTKDLWESVCGLDEGLYFAMDYDLWLRFYPHVRSLITCDHVLSYARTHDKQKSMEENDAGFLDNWVGSALQAANLRGESRIEWLARSYLRRCKRGIRTRNPALLKPSIAQRYATHLIIR